MTGLGDVLAQTVAQVAAKSLHLPGYTRSPDWATERAIVFFKHTMQDFLDNLPLYAMCLMAGLNAGLFAGMAAIDQQPIPSVPPGVSHEQVCDRSNEGFHVT